MPADRSGAKGATPRWRVTAYIVCHDIKFGGYVEGVVESPAKPDDRAIDDLIATLMREKLAGLGDTSPGRARYDVVSVEVTPA